MHVPVIEGTIRRRILVNFAADPAAVSRILPAPLRPKLAGDRAVVGICLIRLEGIRPRHLPAALGISSENAAHRIAVAWEEGGQAREGVYIPRRDTSSMLNHFAGGRLFPGEHHLATFDVTDDHGRIALAMRAEDGGTTVTLRGVETDTFSSSIFPSLDAASAFFRSGSLGYSARTAGDRLDGITLHTDAWKVSPFRVDEVRSSFFEDMSRFAPGSVAFDCALLMRDVPHEWRSEPELCVQAPAAYVG
jgi:hypothetical protein